MASGPVANGTTSGGRGSKSCCGINAIRNFIVVLTVVGSLCSYALLGHLVTSEDASDPDLDFAMAHLLKLSKEVRVVTGQRIQNITEVAPMNASKIVERNETDSLAAVYISNETESNITESSDPLPTGLRSVLERSIEKQKICKTLEEKPIETPPNITDLPNFGIIQALSGYKPKSDEEEKRWNQCKVPPSTECSVNKFTVIFLAYNPERLKHMSRMIGRMTDQHTGEWSDLVEEVVIVWNGDRELTETKDGANLVKMTQQRDLRIVYPLKLGYPNDLLNRYNPDVVNVTTKAILYYDDDGPFYSRDAVMAGFELWKRNSNAQIGAMARRLDVGPRQVAEKQKLFQGLSDRHFVSHCRACGDSVFYNYKIFANYGANMVLPSGSFLHSDYLCFVWHPALEELREFVRADAVHPDDATVSMVASQVGGRAPMVYSRRVNAKQKLRRRLLEQTNDDTIVPIETPATSERRRKLLWEQANWGDMRNSAVNSLVSYFGSVNSGSLAWCHGTPYQAVTKRGEHVCDPEMAKIGMLPWMTDTHKQRDTCP